MSERPLLTGRQVEFLTLLAYGNRHQQIAELCYVTKWTVDDTLDAARERLRAHTLAQAVAMALDLGLIVVHFPREILAAA